MRSGFVNVGRLQFEIVLREPVLLAALFLAMAASGEPSVPRSPRYVLHHVGDDQGLATKTVTTLVQDRVGTIWIGTQDGRRGRTASRFRAGRPAVFSARRAGLPSIDV